MRKHLGQPLDKSKDALSGQNANHDFIIDTDTVIRMEWKGPWMYDPKRIAQDCLKLLCRVPDNDLKLMCAIVASSNTGNKDHLEALERHFQRGISFACKLLEIDSLEDSNLFAYIATITEFQTIKCHWGPFLSVNKSWQPIVAESDSRR